MATNTELLAEASALINTFDTKKTDIEAAVAAAIAAVPVMTATFYVDNITGADTNDGSSGSPFATLTKAVGAVGHGYSATIYLTEGQTHQWGADVSSSAAAIKIVPTGNGTQTIINVDSTDNGANNRSFYLISKTPLALNITGFFKFTFAGKSNAGLPWERQNAFIGYTSTGMITLIVNGHVSNDMEIEVNDGQSFISNHVGHSPMLVNLYLVDITLKAGSSASHLISASGGNVISGLSAVTITGATFTDSLADIIGDTI